MNSEGVAVLINFPPLTFFFFGFIRLLYIYFPTLNSLLILNLRNTSFLPDTTGQREERNILQGKT